MLSDTLYLGGTNTTAPRWFSMSEPESTLPPPSPHFAWTAALFEGAIAVLAVGIGWLLNFQPLALGVCTPEAVVDGVLASLPPLCLVGLSVRFGWGPLRSLTRLVDESVTPLFHGCNLIDMACIALLAGVGEELLFRGLFQAGLARLIGGDAGVWVGLIVAAVLFGLLHWLTATYALLAGLIGLYLGILLIVTDNLVVAMVAHTAYDLAMLVYLVRLRKPISNQDGAES
jgi:uncharacterized protein